MVTTVIGIRCRSRRCPVDYELTCEYTDASDSRILAESFKMMREEAIRHLLEKDCGGPMVQNSGVYMPNLVGPLLPGVRLDAARPDVELSFSAEEVTAVRERMIKDSHS